MKKSLMFIVAITSCVKAGTTQSSERNGLVYQGSSAGRVTSQVVSPVEEEVIDTTVNSNTQVTEAMVSMPSTQTTTISNTSMDMSVVEVTPQLEEEFKEAVIYNDESKVKELLKRCPVLAHHRLLANNDGWNGFTFLHLAARHNADKAIEALIRAEANIEAKDKIGRTPLSMASNWNQCKAVRALIYAGAEIEALSKDGKTPLFTAVMGDGIKAVNMLIGNNANVDARTTTEGRTSLLQATYNQNIALVDALLSAGANRDLLTNAGESARTLIEGAFGRSTFYEQHKQRKLLEDILDRLTGKDLHRYATLLHCMVLKKQRGSLENYAYLTKHTKEYGLDQVNKQDKDGNTPLHLAAIKADPEYVRAVLDIGIHNPYSLVALTKNNRGYTPRQIAEVALSFILATKATDWYSMEQAFDSYDILRCYETMYNSYCSYKAISQQEIKPHSDTMVITTN